jgi:hypothetical protein
MTRLTTGLPYENCNSRLRDKQKMSLDPILACGLRRGRRRQEFRITEKEDLWTYPGGKNYLR